MYFQAKGARARIHFQTTYYLYFIAQITRTPFLFFVNITKDKPPSRKNVQLSEKACMLRFTGLSVVETVKKLENASVGW